MAATLRLLCALIIGSYCYSVSRAAQYSNSFAVEVQGGRDKADEIAAKYGFTNMGPVSTPALFGSPLLKSSLEISEVLEKISQQDGDSLTVYNTLLI